ncbi:TPA: AAA family ATPase, partial [Shigella sonnei]|nr:AAA family ATPase [Shigella sonnei]
MTSFEQLSKVAQRADKMLLALTKQIQEQKQEFQADVFYQVYSKSAVAKLPKLTRASVDGAVGEMEAQGYQFEKRPAGTATKYALTIQNIIDIYAHRGIPKYRDRYSEAYSIFIGSLKGGVSKTVSSVSVAHALRAHPHLLSEDLRILLLDLDPQSSATMFLNYLHAVGLVDTTAPQAMLQNVSREELLEDFIVPSVIPGVYVMPASIDDAFIASNWDTLCEEHLLGQNKHAILRENII